MQYFTFFAKVVSKYLYFHTIRGYIMTVQGDEFRRAETGPRLDASAFQHIEILG